MYQNYFKFMVEIISILKGVKTFLICRRKKKRERIERWGEKKKRREGEGEGI